jgi:N-acetylmuramoyl-L-alanine amidase
MICRHPDPYQETVKLSPNRGDTIVPLYIILHHSGGSFEGGVSWILNPKSKVSYHYLIDPENGNRVQMVWDSKRAWHAGRSQWQGRTGLNSHSVGIAFSGDTNKRTPSEIEIDSVAHKCVYLMNKFKIKKDGILTHQMIAPQRKNDCSPETYQLVIERIDELL